MDDYASVRRQTYAIVKFGIDELLPAAVELVHGPGCPVCVMPLELIDKAIEIAAREGVIFCSFGEILRVPVSERACCICSVAAAEEPLVTICSRIGATRILDLLSGQQLPRICQPMPKKFGSKRR